MRGVWSNMQKSRFFYYSSFVLVYAVLVIVWGAYVRATGSGAGCGNHWPLCNGQVIPQDPEVKTLIELSHRVTSGFMLLLVAFQILIGFRYFPRGSTIRLGVTLGGALTVVEAAIGAGLVLLELVAENDSALRAVVIAFHLVNTFFLLAALAFTVFCLANGQFQKFKVKNWRITAIFLCAWFMFLLVGASGAVVALGDTLFPSKSFVDGLAQDFSQSAHFLIRLRIIHPFFAILTSLYLMYVAARYRALNTLGLVLILQICVGSATMFLAAPISLQLIHLVVADLTWLVLVFFSFRILLGASGEEQQHKKFAPNVMNA